MAAAAGGGPKKAAVKTTGTTKATPRGAGGNSAAAAGAAAEPAEPQYANPLMKQIEDGTVEVKLHLWIPATTSVSDILDGATAAQEVPYGYRTAPSGPLGIVTGS